MSQRLTPKHPTMIAMRSRMEVLKSQIRSETVNAVQSLKTDLSGQLRGNNGPIVDPALVPGAPSKPDKKAALVFGLVGGLLLGVLVANVVEFLDQSIRGQDDVESKLKLPFLGAIPHQRKMLEPVYAPLLAAEASLTGEAFRSLRTMVDFAGVESKASTFLLTSSVQGEGKTFVASSLAVACAQNHEKVLLIDGDLRRPRLHRHFRLSSNRGLSDFLAKGKSVEELAGLVQVSEVAGLGVLVCGVRPPNPSELLNTPRTGALLAWARAHYDRVIVDCAPMFPIHDTLLWGRHVKSGIFVARYGASRLPAARDANRRLASAGVSILGVVVNAARTGGLAYAEYTKHYQDYSEDDAERTGVSA
jgi:capsular exopolysaccharide synthesis family protein